MLKKQLGIIGSPIKHSLSPVLQSYLIEKLDLPFQYSAFEVAKNDLNAAIEGAKALGFRGLNVTLPHKQRIMPLLDEIDAFALETGAVNTVLFSNGVATGYNTDLFGFLDSLRLADVCMTDRDVVVLGAGGAACAIISAAKKESARSINICNRTREKAETLAKKSACRSIDIDDITHSFDNAIVINATSVGMFPDIDETPLPKAAFRKNFIYIDIVYNPQETLFLQHAKAAGAKTVRGLGMLIFQGIMGMEIWSGLKINRKQNWPPLQQLLIDKMNHH